MSAYARHLVSVWDMSNINTYDTGPGGVAADMVGVGLAAGNLVQGIHGRSMATEFDGATEYTRSIIGAPYRSGDSQGTLAAWIKLGAIGAAQIVFGSSDEASDVRALLFRISSTNRIEVVRVLTGSATDAVNGTTTAFVVGQWYHVAWVSTGSVYVLYVDGQAEALAVSSGANGGDWFADVPLRDSVTMGVWRRTGLLNYFNGVIDDVRYYSQPLTQLQITDLLLQSRQGRAG